MSKFPSAKEIIEEAKNQNPQADINQLHALTYGLMKKYRDIYYPEKIKEFFSRDSLSDLSEDIKLKIERELLKPIIVDDKTYSNFMEESSRRISQIFQVISGNLAELCVEKELIQAGLKEGFNYERKKERTDLIIYHPKLQNYLKKHRVEIKNVKLRERGVRGLKFDGDSIIGFFDDPKEFTEGNIDIISRQCKKTNGYCYLPPKTLEELKDKVKNKRFKSNKEFIFDMKKFAESGII